MTEVSKRRNFSSRVRLSRIIYVPKNSSLLTVHCSLLIVHCLFLFIFFSCATVSQVEGPAESPESVSPQWTPVSVSGLEYFSGKVSRPRVEFHALRVDLTEPNLRVVAVPGGTGNDGKTVSIKVSSFVRENGLLAGINALPFDMSSETEGEPRINVGIVIADGIILSPPHKRYDALVFYKDGHTAIVAQSEIKDHDLENIENAVGGFYRILEHGELVPRVLNFSDRHPRSAAGISPDGKFLYLLVIDGRQLKSIGSTEAETALLFKALGASEAINFDGGGSSALALRYPDNTVRVVNIPIHGNIPGRERAVAGCLGIMNK
jgi:hypothetical protein